MRRSHQRNLFSFDFVPPLSLPVPSPKSVSSGSRTQSRLRRAVYLFWGSICLPTQSSTPPLDPISLLATYAIIFVHCPRPKTRSYPACASPGAHHFCPCPNAPPHEKKYQNSYSAALCNPAHPVLFTIGRPEASNTRVPS